MSRRILLSAAFAFWMPSAVCAQQQQAATFKTPAQTAIETASESIARQPDYLPWQNNLAMGYAMRAEETLDAGYYTKAEEVLDRSFQSDPENFEAMKTRVFILLGRCEFAKALEYAIALHKRIPDDLIIRGYLAEAYSELGDYEDAVQVTQEMLNIRAGNSLGLTRAAYLRELHGDFAGAVDFTHKAYDATPAQELSARAGLLTTISRLQLLSGNVPQAESYANSALGLFPDYPYALGALAQARLAKGRNDDAVTLLEKRYASTPRTGTLFDLAQALDRAGRKDAAGEAFAEFEQKAILESGMAANSNHDLVEYYVDRAHQPAKALEVARRELTRRHDAYTLDAFAWALAASGDYAKARVEMQKATAFGTKDPEILRHSTEISRHLPQPAAPR